MIRIAQARRFNLQETLVRAVYDLVAARLGLGAEEQEFRHRHPADVLWHRLQAVPERWLLIIDNADDCTMLAPSTDLDAGTEWLRPPVADSLGRMLITSRDCRNGSWPAC